MKASFVVALVLLLPAVSLAGAPDLPDGEINNVHNYSCGRRFLEGQGVKLNSISCQPGQQLGFIDTEYGYYSFQNSRGEGNMPRKPTEEYYLGGASLCGIHVKKYWCEQPSSAALFRLAGTKGEYFHIPVLLPTAPGLSPELFGFAAPLNKKSGCDEGLIKVSAQYAEVPSITQPLPTNFINQQGSLRAIRLAPTGQKLSPFVISRTPAGRPCDKSGVCEIPNGNTYDFLKVEYSWSAPPVCVLAPVR